MNLTVTEPQVSEGARYTTTQTCQILGINYKTLIRHTMAGHIKCGFRRPTARRFYSGAEIKRYWKAIF